MKSNLVSEELALKLDTINFSRYDIQQPIKIDGVGELYPKLTLNEVQDWFREKHDIHIQIIINSWIKREYEYRIHTTNLYVNSHKFVDNPILGDYYYVLENAIFHCINIVDDMKKSKKFFK